MLAAVGAPTAVAHATNSQHEPGVPPIETGKERAIGSAIRTAIDYEFLPAHPLTRHDVDHARHGEIAVHRTGRSLEYFQARHCLRHQQAPVVVALGVSIHRFVDRHTINPECQVGGMIRRKPADRGIGCKARPLPLLMHFDAGNLTQQVPGVRRRRRGDHGGCHSNAAHRRLTGRGARGDRDRLQVRRRVRQRIARRARCIGGCLLGRQRGWRNDERQQ